MPGAPFLKSNRVEDIRLVLGELAAMIGSGTGVSTPSTLYGQRKDVFVLGSNDGKKGEKGERGEKGDSVQGLPGEDGVDGSLFEPLMLHTRSRDGLRTRDHGLLSIRPGYLVEARVRDTTFLVDHEGTMIRRQTT